MKANDARRALHPGKQHERTRPRDRSVSETAGVCARDNSARPPSYDNDRFHQVREPRVGWKDGPQ